MLNHGISKVQHRYPLTFGRFAREAVKGRSHATALHAWRQVRRKLNVCETVQLGKSAHLFQCFSFPFLSTRGFSSSSAACRFINSSSLLTSQSSLWKNTNSDALNHILSVFHMSRDDCADNTLHCVFVVYVQALVTLLIVKLGLLGYVPV